MGLSTIAALTWLLAAAPEGATSPSSTGSTPKESEDRSGPADAGTSGSDDRTGPADAGTSGPESAKEAKADSKKADSKDAKPKSAADDRDEAREKRRRMFREPGGPKDKRKWMIGVEGVVIQAPPIRPEVVYLDPRFIGRSIAMGGVGLFGRYRPSPYVGFDLGVRSGSVRYQNRGDKSNQVSQDQVMADLGVLVYLGRGEVAQFALSGGVGGLYNRIGYDLGSRDGVQTFGSGLVRVGGEAEFIVKRVAFVLSFRTYGIFTNRDATQTRGEVFSSDTVDDRAPVATYQTFLVGTAGIAYRF
jgi:hypothetical protein